MGYPPIRQDEEIASLKLEQDIAIVAASDNCEYYRWSFNRLEKMYWIWGLFAERPDGTRDQYWVRLGAEYYDASGPTVYFCDPDGIIFHGVSHWFPKLAQNPPWAALHPNYQHKDHSGQLVCYSYNAIYELTHGAPAEHLRWQQGVHKVSAALNKLQHVLEPEYYECRSA